MWRNPRGLAQPRREHGRGWHDHSAGTAGTAKDWTAEGFVMQAVVTIEGTGGNTTGIRAAHIVDQLDAGKRPRVKAVFPNGHELRTRMGSHDGDPFIPVSGATREQAEVAAGHEVEVVIEVENEPVVIEVPDDLAAALAEVPAAKDFFDGLTASQQKGFTTSVTSAKRPETRLERVRKAITALEQGQKRP